MPDSHNVIRISTPREHIGTLSYIASPYSSPDKAVMVERFEAAAKATAFLMNRLHAVYSPIVHSHTIAQRHELPTDWEYWRVQCVTMLSRCDQLYVLRLEGWETSVGVQAEIKLAEQLQLEISHMDPLPSGGYRIGGGVR